MQPRGAEGWIAGLAGSDGAEPDLDSGASLPERAAHHRRTRVTKMLDAAIAAVQRLPADQQDVVASAVIGLGLLDLDVVPEEVDPAHRAAIEDGARTGRAGRFHQR